jgi:hypothetical protein
LTWNAKLKTSKLGLLNLKASCGQMPNIGLELTAYSVRFASASGSGSGPAFGPINHTRSH